MDIQHNLLTQLREVIRSGRNTAIQQVNELAVITNFEIGRRIVEFEQKGQQRAEYGKQTLIEISEALTDEFGRGYSVDNLQLMRTFYLVYQDRSILTNKDENYETPSRNLKRDRKSETLSRIFHKTEDYGFKLSWSHYVELIKMDEKERGFYEIECFANNWSVRELRRQYNSSLYERVALSKNKEEVKALSKKGQMIQKPSDMLKQPYILDFLGLKEEPAYTESQLEQAIIDKIENFLLELGKGFLFEARQKRISFEGDDYYIDLVFYNRLLRCYVLFDLKIGKLTHKDIGQMQMYVNYFDRAIKIPEEKPTVGIILCKQNNKTVVEFTLSKGQEQIYAREYKLYLPEKEELKKQLDINTEE